MKRGFTLIELLAVITILSIIVLIASVSLSNVLKDSKEDLSNSQITAIKEAAKSWSSDNMDILPSGNNCSFLTLKDLKEDGLIDEEIIDPKDKKNISNDLKIKIESKMNGTGNSNLTYEVNPDSIKDCLYIGSDMYVDLPQGLTPVIYDGTNWKVPKKNEEWYNYDKQMWANAVVLESGKTKKPGEIVTVEGDNPDALMMLVYIPRYEYKIEGKYGTHTDGTEGTTALPGEIEVKFINNSKTTSDDGYILHPAFKFGEQQLHGLWVGKFEISHVDNPTENNSLGCNQDGCTSDISKLRILPNVSSLRNNDVSNFFYAIRSIENTSTFGLNNMDTHMMKNSEWGAVAYLSQSKYGKYGNNDYEGAQKEVYINNSSSYYTGRSGGNSGGNTKIKDTYTDQTSTTQYSYYGYYTYDGYLLSYNTNNKTETRDINKGTGASTTGNIYGVYDMSGGAYEYVMGAYGDEQGIYSGYNTSTNSGFTGRTGNDNSQVEGATVPDSKYYDIYKTTNVSTACDNNGPCLGHAMSETANWYGDNTFMVSSSFPWFLRGGYYGHISGAGVFYRGNVYGCGYDSASARVVGFGK